MIRNIWAGAAILALSLAACSENDAAPDETALETAQAETAEAGPEILDEEVDGEAALEEEGRPGQSPPVNLAQDVAAGPAGMVDAIASGGEADSFVRSAWIANQYEIAAAEIALEKSESPEVRELAQMIIDDHRRNSENLVEAVDRSEIDIELPQSLDERRQGLIDNLQAAADADFDAAYLHQQAAAHLEAITLFEGYSERGEVNALTRFADASVPTLQKHLEKVRESLDDAVDGQ